MNISLNSKKSKKKTNLGYGLNKRSTVPSTSTNNVFGEDDDGSSEDDTTKGDARQRINQQIAKEQAALRQRAQAVMQTSGTEGSIYDYDSAYDSFQPKQKSEKSKPKEEKKSRYIGDLLETAKKRQQERETVYERKIAKEQALEDAKEDYAGKEKFITKAYRRKLEERKQFEAEEEARQKEEDANDVTKQTQAGVAMASFYGNLSQNVAMGGAAFEKTTGQQRKSEKEEKKEKESADKLVQGQDGGGIGFLAGFERSEGKPADSDEREGTRGEQGGAQEDRKEDTKPHEETMTMRERREQKVASARIRYMKRKGVMVTDQ